MEWLAEARRTQAQAMAAHRRPGCSGRRRGRARHRAGGSGAALAGPLKTKEGSSARTPRSAPPRQASRAEGRIAEAQQRIAHNRLAILGPDATRRAWPTSAAYRKTRRILRRLV
jgi:hypothetical protein